MSPSRTLPDQIVYHIPCPVCGTPVTIYITGDPAYQRCWDCRSTRAYHDLMEKLGYEPRIERC